MDVDTLIDRGFVELFGLQFAVRNSRLERNSKTTPEKLQFQLLSVDGNARETVAQ